MPRWTVVCRGGEIAHGGELLFGGGEAGLDRGDFAEPSLFLGLAEPVEQVGVVLLQPRHLRGVGPKDGAADACLRCPLIQPDPAQKHRLDEIIVNLRERLSEAHERGWLGEVEGLEITIAAAEHKLAGMTRQINPLRARRPTATPTRPVLKKPIVPPFSLIEVTRSARTVTRPGLQDRPPMAGGCCAVCRAAPQHVPARCPGSDTSRKSDRAQRAGPGQSRAPFLVDSVQGWLF
ncbi:hypothetical protein [Streptomyces albireticuli]|uniref:hypothetical protein n=1 Tax=Streptomyces albireticuli TaxID=1940 RepID=UPI001475053F|nr:hypothetical protein [Streptomyces albireticuli]MCD9145440.1 hypothetical protein [Streptomyces albireticuli]MCD9164995.1 hypothetical protein [Streptomyces albireticuli]MCD9195414.1 hypothetical protein [Streptomyces albireticuli]